MIILNFLIQAIKIILMLSVLVIIHELGHFTVAKLFKIPVKEFSVGFGKKLFSKEKKGTVYSIRLFLLGGYVDIDDEAKEGSFAQAPLYQKNLILSAGVFVNILFAFVFGIILLFSQGNFSTNRIETINEQAPIYSSGIKVGDEIYKINGKKIKSKNQIDTVMSLMSKENINIDVKRDGKVLNYVIEPYIVKYPSAGFMINENNQITMISKNSDIEKAGIIINDKIVSVNNINVTTNEELSNELLNIDTELVNIQIDRNNEILSKQIEIQKIERKYIGVTLESVENTFLNKLRYSFIGIGDYIYENFRGLFLLITGQNQNAQLMGIIGVSEIITRTTNISEYLSIMVSISLSLAIVNLFPFPILDGGKIVMFTIERYRKKHFSEKFVGVISTVTMVLLVILTVYIMIGDIIRIV